MYNMQIDKNGNTSNSQSYFAENKKPEENCVLHEVPHDETRCALLANIFLSEGKPGKVSDKEY